jgi:hypothetical protein
MPPEERYDEPPSRPDGEIGRRTGLKIPWRETSVRVRSPLRPLAQCDAVCCELAREAPDYPALFAFFFAIVAGLSLASSVQSGAIRNSRDASRLAPFSAPLGTIAGTFSGPSF